jgi:hypothetical protein
MCSTTMKISTQIESAVSKLDGFSLGIYHIYEDNQNPKNMPFSRYPMVINQSMFEQNRNVNAIIMRDIEFSFLLRSKCRFQIGLFAFHPKYMKYNDIKHYYADHRVLPQNDLYLYDMGIHDLEFNIGNMVLKNDSHFIVKSGALKFTFYFMELDRNEHYHLYQKEGIMNNSDERLFYISNPNIYFALSDF